MRVIVKDEGSKAGYIERGREGDQTALEERRFEVVSE